MTKFTYNKKVKKGIVKVYCKPFIEKLHDTATECHSPYGITQCYLLPDTSEHSSTHPAFTPARQAGTRFTDHLRVGG